MEKASNSLFPSTSRNSSSAHPRRPPREYAELGAFADEQRSRRSAKPTGETMVMARRLMTPGQGPRTELPRTSTMSTGDYVKTRTTSQFKWMLHASRCRPPWTREFVCSSGREWVEETVNLFRQRGFSSTPEEVRSFRLTRKLCSN